MLFFGRSFPFIWVRNFLFVGLPYFCIGTIIRNGFGKKIDSWLLALLIGVFTITTLLERFILVSVNMNGERDHYISTTFLAIAVFLFYLKSVEKTCCVAVIGKKYSTWLYILHPICITCVNIFANRAGIYEVYKFVAPIIIYAFTLLFLMIMDIFKKIIANVRQ